MIHGVSRRTYQVKETKMMDRASNRVPNGSAWLTVTVVAILALSAVAAGVHLWSTRGELGVGGTVPDGTVVLVRQDRTLGAFVLSEQREAPEACRYVWHYRTDGRGTFRASDSAAAQSGSGVAVGAAPSPVQPANTPSASIKCPPGKPISFGPFFIGWSIATNGSGSVYYNRTRGDKVYASDTGICVTNAKDIEKIDALDHRWVYKRSPDDPGVYGDGTSVGARPRP